jgi:transposase-like protein
MFTADKTSGIVGSIVEVFPDANYQHCMFHFYCNVLMKVTKVNRERIAAMLKAIHVIKSRKTCVAKGHISR